MPAGYAAESEINNSLGVLSEQLKQLGEGVEKSGDLRLQHVFDNWADDTKVFSIIALVEGIDQTSDQVKLIAKSIKAVIQAFYAQLIALKDNRSLYQKFAGTVLLTAKRLEAAVEGLFKSSFADTPLSIKEDLASWKRDPLKLYENNNLLDTIVKIVDEYKAAVAVKEAL